MRAGAYALSLLSVPLNGHVLRALDEEPTSLMDLRRAVGSPPQTTMRGHLKTLSEIGVLDRIRRNDFPASVDYELAGPGRELLAVADVVQDWLTVSPDGPLSLGTVASKSAVKALVEGWSASIVRALAARPLSLTELNRLISGISYPSLERRLAAMRMAGQIEACPGQGKGTPYAVTRWLRQAIAPLAVAANWERRHTPAAASPIGRIDVESVFLLVIPTLGLPSDLSGSCRLAVEIRNGGSRHVAGVRVSVCEGRVVSCTSRLDGDAEAWVAGSISAWLSAVIEQETERLEIGGACGVTEAILQSLHGALFGARQLR